ncbi:MAG TPA: UDP-N-acetylmuramyl-tripeptide synthetase, partial [bacterium]|nr:UDP-N-acetylmuramyl-tripeptide synthetase [bacterium]
MGVESLSLRILLRDTRSMTRRFAVSKHGLFNMAFESIRLSHLLGFLESNNLERIADPWIDGLTVDSRRVEPGWIFVAVSGTRMNGHEFVDEAIGRGAAAVVVEHDVGTRTVPVIRVPNSRAAAARLASAFYGNPEKSIEIVGITGTNGKTTVALLLESIFHHAGRQTGLIGTLFYRWKKRKIKAERTTPDAIELFALIRRMADEGVRSLIMEVSSHALDMDRVHGLRFQGAVFTNLSRDHLDYHKTMKAYANTKSRLFRSLDPFGVGVINADDPMAALMSKAAAARVVTYGARKTDSDYRVKPNPIQPPGFLLIHRGRTLTFPTGLPGSFNRLNAAAAA